MGHSMIGRFVAGLMGWQWAEDTMMLSPYVGWALYTHDQAQADAVKAKEEEETKRWQAKLEKLFQENRADSP